MADENIQRMLVQIEATTAGLRRELDKGESKVKQFAGSSDKSAQAVDRNFSGMATSVGRLIAPLTAAVAAFASLGKLVETQRQFDRLNAGLITATGSSEKASVAFRALQDFAAKTPYSLDQAVEGFSKLVNLGLTPSEKALTSYGNTAAAMGKDLNQMIEAVADAATGEFERLKEFGITSSQQGDKVSLTFRGVTTTIGKSAKEIEGYLMNLGLVDFAGAMDERAKTLDGQLSNLADTWDQTYRLINQQGIGQAMADAVAMAGDALTELNTQLESGQFEGYLAAVGESFSGYGEDFARTIETLQGQFSDFFEYLGVDGKLAVESLKVAFSEFPETLRSYIQRMVVEFASGFDRVSAYAVAFKDAIKAVFTDDTIADVQARLNKSLAVTAQARQSSIDQIEVERSAAARAVQEQITAADAKRKKFDEDRAAAAAAGKDRLAEFSKQTEAAKTLSKEEENKLKQQAKALADLLAQSKISTDAANALADAYLNGQDQLAKFTLQEKISQELLKTGAAARDKVTAAIEGQLNAEARRDVAKATYDLRTETAALDLQAAATLQGKSALEAFNVERAKAAILSGKNVDALTEETRQYLEAFEANQKATKALQQAGEVEGIMDRLQPQAKLLKDYTKEVDALTAAMQRNPEKAAQYAETLRLLGLEYEQNRVAATAWGQFTEGAVDRVDEAFADAWKNIGKGFDGFATSLKDGFKQLLAELAHMAITKPIIMQIGAAMGVGGLSASQGVGGIGGSGGGGLNIVSLAQNAYSVYSGLTGVGSAIYGGYQVGGLTGAAQAGVGYYGNMLSNGANYVSGLFGGASGAAAGSAAASSAAGASAAGYTGQAYANWAAGQYASQAANNIASTISSYGPYFAAIAGALQGWQAAGFKGAVAGAGGAVGGFYAGAQVGSYFGPIGTAIGGAIGAVAGAAFGSKLFGGQWQTKDAGLSLGVEGGDLSATGFEYQKKKGGLFGKNKKRTVFNALDADTQAALDMTFDAGMDQIQALYEQFGIDVSQSALDGLSIAATQISTKGKTTEELQQLIGDWFTGTFDSITDQINTAMGSQFRAGLTLDGLKLLLGNLISVNGMLDLLNVGVLKITPAGAYAAEALQALAGGMDKLTENVNGYYGAFFTEAEKQADTLSAVNAQFQAMGVALPPLRQGYRDIVSAIDVSTAAGQAMFTSLTSLWQTASSYYDILEAQAKAAAQAQAEAQASMLSGAMGTLQRAVQRQQTVLTDAYNARAEGLNASLGTSQGVMSSLTSMANGLASAMKTLQGQSDAAQSVLYQQAQATLVSAAAIARAGGSIAGLAGIDDALSAVTNNDASRYGNWEDFARDQGRSLVLIDELNSAAGGQLDQAQASVKALQDQIALAKKQYDMESTKLQGQLDLAQAQIDGINGIDTRLLSVNEALAEILAAITKASPNGTGATNADSIIEAAYRAALGRSADAAGAAYWKQQLASGAVNSNNLSTAIAAAGAANAAAAPSQVASAYASSLGRMPTEADMAYWTAQMASGAVTDIGAAIKASAVANGQIPAFASGGSYLGGLALVGERGPEVIDFNQPGQVFNARQTAGMLSSADLSALIAEVQGLRQQTADMRGALSDIAKHTNGTRAAVQQQNDAGLVIAGTVTTKAVTA